jgi:heme exporter protein C
MSSLSKRLPILAAAAAGLLGLGVVLALFVAPDDADQGFSYRIFYMHVPIVLTAYTLFIWGGWKAFRRLQTKQERYDLESYVAIHLGVIFGCLTLLTGSIWAKVSWGHWWLWDQKQLVLFLVLFLFYCAYFMLRFSVEDGTQRQNLSSVYALFGVVLIPVCSLAIRLMPKNANQNHPVMNGLPFHGWIRVAFLVCLAGMLVLAAALYHFELLGKRLDLRLRDLREAKDEHERTPEVVAA